MALYRLIFRDHETGSAEEAEIQCDTDGQAIAEAQEKADGRTVIIWHGDDRWIGTFEG